MEIRRFSGTDNIDDVSHVYAQSWKSAYRGIVPQDYLDSIPEDRWSKILLGELSNLWVVSDGKRIIGSSTYAPARDEKYGGWGEIISIYLLPEYFHQGIGTKLLRASMNGLFTMGYGSLYLWVLEDNCSAHRFYEKSGFRFNGDIMQSVIGGKPLNEARYVFKREPHDE
ncbi:MAG: N-acetyltransferase family protein [Oscillospiraceae bacterium]